MKVLKIETNDIRQKLTDSGIVICTYEEKNGSYIDAISIEYKAQYPDLVECEVLENINK